MARLILTVAGEDLPAGGNSDVIGTAAGGEVITVLDGNVTFDPSFNQGGDTIDLPGNASAFTVQRSGSNAIIVGNGVSVTIPIGNQGLDVRFDDATLSLRVDGSSPVLGNQVITTAAAQVNPAAPPVQGPTPIIAEASGANDSTASAQVLNRNSFTVGDNVLLPDDSLPSATISGTISTDNDIDFFAITLEAGEKLVLDVDRTLSSDPAPPEFDTMLRIYDSNGALIVGPADDSPSDPGSDVDYDGNQTLDSLVSFRAPTSGTYYFSIESYADLNDDGEDDGPNIGSSSGSYRLNVSVGPTATEAQILQEDVEALISGSSWSQLDLSYAFPNSIGDYTTANEDDYVGFEPFTAAQQQVVTQFLQQIANVTNLSFILRPDGQESGATLRYAMSTAPDAAYAYYPGSSPVSGTAWFNPDDFNNAVPGNYAWMGILHETGHALGLKHGHEAPPVSFERDSVEYTVMTYRSYPGDSLAGGYTNETWGYPQTLMMLDIAALQQLYGADYTFNGGNTTYSWNPTTGQMSVNGIAGLLPGNGAQGANRVFMTIWDGGGTDTYDLSNYSTAVTIDLRPGHWTTTSVIQLANLGLGNRAEGNVANSLLFEGNPASLIENAIGGPAGDTLIANQAANRLTGNGGSDIFDWNSVADAGLGALADIVADFVPGLDDLDLSGIDAIQGGGDDAFTFIGNGAFTGTAGQLRFQAEAGGVRIQGDVDGNGVADFEIILNGLNAVNSTDFVL